jgi:hypothetical protein
VLLTKYYSGNKIKKDEMGAACNTYGERIGAYRVLVGRPEGGKSLERPRRRWEDNIKIDLQEVGWDKDCIDVAQERDKLRGFVNAAMNLRAP